jgi:hypothetical protein
VDEDEDDFLLNDDELQLYDVIIEDDSPEKMFFNRKLTDFKPPKRMPLYAIDRLNGVPVPLQNPE